MIEVHGITEYHAAHLVSTLTLASIEHNIRSLDQIIGLTFEASLDPGDSKTTCEFDRIVLFLEN